MTIVAISRSMKLAMSDCRDCDACDFTYIESAEETYANALWALGYMLQTEEGRRVDTAQEGAQFAVEYPISIERQRVGTLYLAYIRVAKRPCLDGPGWQCVSKIELTR